MTARAGSLVLLSLLVTAGCIKVPERVRVSFCAQPAAQNHFGTSAATRSCCPGPPRMQRFGAASGGCQR